MRNPTTRCFAVSGLGVRRFNHRLVLLVAAVFCAAGCHRAPSFPAQWADVRAAADVAFIVGEARSSSHDRPLGAARVRLVAPTGDVHDSTNTDAAGAFVLGPVPPGDYRLEIRAFVHRAFTRPLALRAGAVDTVRLRLEYNDTGLISDCWPAQRPDGSYIFGPCHP